MIGYSDRVYQEGIVIGYTYDRVVSNGSQKKYIKVYSHRVVSNGSQKKYINEYSDSVVSNGSQKKYIKVYSHRVVSNGSQKKYIKEYIMTQPLASYSFLDIYI